MSGYCTTLCSCTLVLTSVRFGVSFIVIIKNFPVNEIFLLFSKLHNTQQFAYTTEIRLKIF